MNSSSKKVPFLMGMPMKIGVMGGADIQADKSPVEKAHRLGEAIAERGCILITGGCLGLPLAAACGAKQRNGFVIGISPGLSLDEHVNKYHSPTEFHDVLIYTGSGLMGREVVNIRSSDIVIIVGGRTGTLGELAIAYDEGKLIGVLTGTGGISDMVADILAACNKKTGARVVYSGDPVQLVEELFDVYEKEHYRRPSQFSREYALGVMSDPTPQMERDVVCGMWTLPEVAVAERISQNKKYFFCSTGCAGKFDADPLKYKNKYGKK